jgi:hypothetical protein
MTWFVMVVVVVVVVVGGKRFFVKMKGYRGITKS